MAIVPTLGTNPSRLQACIASLEESTGSFPVAVVVVWNSPHIEPIVLESVHVLVPGLNLGFAGSLNHGRSRVTADFLWVIQDDLTVRSGCLDALLERLRNDPKLGVVAPITINENGRITQIRSARLTGTAQFPRYPALDSTPDEIDESVELSYVVSSGSLARVSAWDQVDGYDAKFFPVYYSDVDFCFRLRETGWGIALVPNAIIDHDLHGSSVGLLRKHFLAVNSQRFFSKHFRSAESKPEPRLDVDPALVADIAMVASRQLIEFYHFAAREMEHQRLGWKLRHPATWLRPRVGRLLRFLHLR